MIKPRQYLDLPEGSLAISLVFERRYLFNCHPLPFTIFWLPLIVVCRTKIAIIIPDSVLKHIITLTQPSHRRLLRYIEDPCNAVRRKTLDFWRLQLRHLRLLWQVQQPLRLQLGQKTLDYLKVKWSFIHKKETEVLLIDLTLRRGWYILNGLSHWIFSELRWSDGLIVKSEPRSHPGMKSGRWWRLLKTC